MQLNGEFMKLVVSVIIACLCASSVKAQLVRRHATLTNEEGVLTLTDSVRVSASNFKNGSYTAIVHAWVHRDFINGLEQRVMAEAVLFNEKKDTLGRVQESYPLDSLWPSSSHRMSKYCEVVASGKVQGKELERRSFPTQMVERFFEGKRGGSLRDPLVDAFKKQGWERRNFGEYESWGYLNRSSNPGLPDFQALFIFRGSMPYCLVNKGDDFEYEKLKGSEQRTHGMYYFFQRPNDRFLEEIDNIVFDYLPL